MVVLFVHGNLRRAMCIMVVIFACFLGIAAAAEVDVELDRDSVPAGSGALFTLKITGGRAEQPEIPRVENLIMEPRGQSQQMQMFNGRTSVSTIYHYVVGSNTPGDYEIPALKVTVDGKQVLTRPLKLKVLDSAAAKPPAGMQPNAGAGAAGGGDSDEGGKRFGFLTVELANSDRKHVYVGEIAPVRIRAWLPADSRANLRSGIQPEGQAFTLHNVSERPQQSHEIRDGKNYLVVTWYGGISAAKAGHHPVSLSVDATVAVRDGSAPKPRRRTGGPFDDPFFDSMFDNLNTPMIQKDVTLQSEGQQIEVLPLPKDGRPAGFAGAVGDFKIDSWSAPGNWKTGEPQRIQARLSGSGNFSLMTAPTLSPADAWKAYPAKSEFTPGDEASFSGSKVFEFSAVPRKGGDQELSLEFSFFNPDRGAYQTVVASPKRVQVSGKDLEDDKPAASETPNEPQAKKEDGLVGPHLRLTSRGALSPLVRSRDFQLILGVSVILGVLGLGIGWGRRLRNHPGRIARVAMEKAVAGALAAADRCVADGDVDGFFAAGRLAIQQRLGAIWNQSPGSITLAEILSRMPGDSAVAEFIRLADSHAYGRGVSGHILPEWRSLLGDAIRSFHTSAH